MQMAQKKLACQKNLTLEILSFPIAGSLKAWESSIDLVNTLKHEIRDGQLSFRGKRVLEVLQI